jgi:hypothetical protein
MVGLWVVNLRWHVELGLKKVRVYLLVLVADVILEAASFEQDI